MKIINKSITFDRSKFEFIKRNSKDNNPIHFNNSVHNPYFYKIFYGIAFPIEAIKLINNQNKKIYINSLYIRFYYPIPFNKKMEIIIKFYKDKITAILKFKKIILSEIVVSFYIKNIKNNLKELTTTLFKISYQQGKIFPGHYSILSSINIQKTNKTLVKKISFDKRFNYFKIERNFKNFYSCVESFKKTFKKKDINLKLKLKLNQNTEIFFLGGRSFLSQIIYKLLNKNEVKTYLTTSNIKNTSKKYLNFDVNIKKNHFNLIKVIEESIKTKKIKIFYNISPKIFTDDNLVKVFDLEKNYQKIFYSYFKYFIQALTKINLINEIQVIYPSSIFVQENSKSLYSVYKNKAKSYILGFEHPKIKIIYYEFNIFNNYQNHSFKNINIDYLKNFKKDIKKVINLIQ